MSVSSVLKTPRSSMNANELSFSLARMSLPACGTVKTSFDIVSACVPLRSCLNATIEPVEDSHAACTCTHAYVVYRVRMPNLQYATAHISAIFSLNKRFSSRTSPHSFTQGSVSLRFAAHFPHHQEPLHMPNLRHIYIVLVLS